MDISSSNGNIDISRIKKAGYDFAMIRCGYGSDLANQDDTQFENNVKKCEAAGMPWGVYLYSYALNTTEAKSEAQHVLRLLKGKKPTMPVAFDMEDADGYKKKNGMPSNKTLIEICKTFLEEIKSEGYYPMLYASLSWLNNQLNDSSLLTKYDIWVAQWNSTCDYKGSYGIWQYGGETNYLESNSIDGVGTIDKDKCYKDYPTIIKKGGYNGWAKNSATPATPTLKSETAPNVTYKVRTNGKWLPEVKNCEDFAGIQGCAITDVAIKVDKGSVKYRVHVKGGDWLPYVTGYNTSDYTNGYAGNGKEIDGIEIIYYTDTKKNSKYYYATYRVSPIGKTYYDWQKDNEKTNGQDGYAGSLGKAIDRLQIKLTA